MTKILPECTLTDRFHYFKVCNIWSLKYNVNRRVVANLITIKNFLDNVSNGCTCAALVFEIVCKIDALTGLSPWIGVDCPASGSSMISLFQPPSMMAVIDNTPNWNSTKPLPHRMVKWKHISYLFEYEHNHHNNPPTVFFVADKNQGERKVWE